MTQDTSCESRGAHTSCVHSCPGSAAPHLHRLPQSATSGSPRHRYRHCAVRRLGHRVMRTGSHDAGVLTSSPRRAETRLTPSAQHSPAAPGPHCAGQSCHQAGGWSSTCSCQCKITCDWGKTNASELVRTHSRSERERLTIQKAPESSERQLRTTKDTLQKSANREKQVCDTAPGRPPTQKKQTSKGTYQRMPGNCSGADRAAEPTEERLRRF